MGGKPNPGTKRDMRLAANKTSKASSTRKSSASKSAAPKFGSKAFTAKYGKGGKSKG